MSIIKEEMSGGERDKNERREAALLEVVRLGLSGDQRSLRQRARNLLRSGSNPLLSDEGRRYLQNLLAPEDELTSFRGDVFEQKPTAVPLPGEAMPIPDDREPQAPVLERAAEEKVRRLIREYENRHLLEEANLAPTTRVLLAGPPGGGKTMTARFIAARLGVPLLLAEPSQVLTGVMGQSARNLSALMKNAAASPCLLFLDELDAYARRRGETHDIAEPKRLVNTLLLELDRWPVHGLLVAATNHAEVLDEAVRRRFEMTIDLGYPSVNGRREIVRATLERAGKEVPTVLLDVIASSTDNQSGSSLVNETVSAIRRSIIDGMSIEACLGQQFLAARFIGRGKGASEIRNRAVKQLSETEWDEERIAAAIGVSATTVAGISASTSVE
ncbi:MAG TPA: ATP-binding protein [Solirubrobacterales bacterium]